MLTFDTWTLALKKKHRELADDAALYGIDVYQLRRDDYEAYVGLRLNRNRSLLRQAEAVRLGSTATLGTRKLAWFLATTDTEDEAKLAYEQHVTDTMQQSAQSF